MAGFVFVPSRSATGGSYGKLLFGQRPVDGIGGEKFQPHTVLLVICKVDTGPLDVQWNGWLFDDRLSIT